MLFWNLCYNAHQVERGDALCHLQLQDIVKICPMVFAEGKGKEEAKGC